MIKREIVEVEGYQFYYTYSDSNRYIVRDGVSYSEAYDPIEFDRTYTEGDPMEPETVASNAMEILDILTGGSE